MYITIKSTGGRIKENDGGCELNYGNIVRTFVNVTVDPQYNQKINKKKTMKSKNSNAT
jgi:hypothetical protein